VTAPPPHPARTPTTRKTEARKGNHRIVTAQCVRRARRDTGELAPHRLAVCQPDGIVTGHDAGMDDTYLCPDCRAEHAEPYEAVAGHIARCESCVVLLEILDDERAFHAEILEIRIAA
jgi:hypothetical protein